MIQVIGLTLSRLGKANNQMSIQNVEVCEFDIPYRKNIPVIDAFDGCKFIKVKDEDGKIKMLIFPNWYSHNEMYFQRFGGKGIISAGFISAGDTLVATGRSTSINGYPSASNDDTVVLNEYLKTKMA